MRGILKILGLLALWGLVQNSHAVLEIEITEGVESALPIAIAAFTGDTYAAPEAMEDIVRSNLRSSGFFDVLEKQHFPQDLGSTSQVQYSIWREAGVESLLTGEVIQTGDNLYRIEFRLFDLVRQKRLSGHAISSVRREDIRKAGHKISDIVFESLTGIRGAFSTQIAYISTSGSAPNKKYQLQIADADGHNARTIFSSSKQLMSPAWSPDGTRLAYVSFEQGNSAIYVQDVREGRRFMVSAQSGINSAPAWSPNGRYLALTLSIDGSADIYLMDTRTRRLKRLTRDSSIDTEACWMPDSKALLFTSDRSNETQVYRVSVRGGKPKRVTFEGAYNAAPDVSPDGRQLAFVHNSGSGFRIAVMDLRSGAMRILTEGHLDEGPSYAPNGKMIIYAASERDGGVLAAVSANGRAKRKLRTAGSDVRAPSWSPFRN
ncbi:MAG: Tol-Pal system beta propeller repeat protein TolB [Gammaproteobacteria bacterium]|nr:Tol-Pal system beta propeller repeat protein TolB [Gammaproteobacteria bacterium]